jgi:hypothetical protein
MRCAPLLAVALVALSCAPRAAGPLPEDDAPLAVESATPAPPEPAPTAVKKVLGAVVSRATLVAVGDVLLHDSVQVGAGEHRLGDLNAEGYDFLYEQVSQYLAGGDLTFANVETPINDVPPRGLGRWIFSAPPVSVTALKRAGVDVVSIANNHAMDQGRKGFVETMRHFDELGIAYVGGGASVDDALTPKVFELNGIRVAMLGFTELMNEHGNEAPAGQPHVSMFDLKKAVAAIRRAAKDADAVVVSVHWGVEYQTAPRLQEVQYAHAMMEAGATIVLGHHPHVLQPIELYTTSGGRKAIVFYSLGNFIANQGAQYTPEVAEDDPPPRKTKLPPNKDPDSWGRRRDGALMRVELVKKDFGGGLQSVELAGADALPLWTENNLIEAIHAPTVLDVKKKGAPPSEALDIHVVALDRAIENAERELARPDLDLDRKNAIATELDLYQKRKDAIAATIGPDFIRTLSPPSPWPRPLPSPAGQTVAAGSK